jgi:hypothetical protein
MGSRACLRRWSRRAEGQQVGSRPGLLAGQVYIDDRGENRLVPHVFLERGQINPGFHQVRGEAMPQRVAAAFLLNTSLLFRLMIDALRKIAWQGLIQMRWSKIWE